MQQGNNVSSSCVFQSYKTNPKIVADLKKNNGKHFDFS
jgi:hypothetical protein